MLRIDNDGQRIVSTNYFESEHAQLGAAFLSFNSAAVRLLLPPPLHCHLPDMHAGKFVVVSRGRLDVGKMGYSVMFDDGSQSPFVLTMTPASTGSYRRPTADGNCPYSSTARRPNSYSHAQAASASRVSSKT